MNRRSRRSNVLMTATIEISGESFPVKLRNLSADGALVEADGLPIEGAPVIFHRNDLSVSGHFAWVHGKRGGVAFDEALSPDELLRHVPTPQPRTDSNAIYRRPGLMPRQLTASERQIGEAWVFRSGKGDKVGD